MTYALSDSGSDSGSCHTHTHTLHALSAVMRIGGEGGHTWERDCFQRPLCPRTSMWILCNDNGYKCRMDTGNTGMPWWACGWYDMFAPEQRSKCWYHSNQTCHTRNVRCCCSESLPTISQYGRISEAKDHTQTGSNLLHPHIQGQMGLNTNI